MTSYYLLTQREHKLYEHHINQFFRNIKLFLLVSLLTFLILTFAFREMLSLGEHIGMFIGLCAYLIFSYGMSKIWEEKNLIFSSKQSTWTVFWILSLWMLWLNTYFYILSQYGLGIDLMLFALLWSVVYMVRIALLGQFFRINLFGTLATVLNITTIVWRKDTEVFKDYYQSGYALAFFLIVFLYIYNKQLADLFKTKDYNQRLVDALKQKNIALEQSNLAQSRYISAASHDLRQPLHALALLTNDAQHKNTSPEVGRTLEKIDQAIDSLSKSFNSVLNLSRLDAGVVKPEFNVVSLQRIFDRIRVEFEEVAVQKNIELVAVPTQLWVQSDEGMLHSILSNFVSNALRYTEEGKVLVGARRTSDSMVRVLVYDTGTGVPADKARKIFQEYQRLEYAQQRVTGGVGLGLAISERMARLLGAQLLVQSTMGRGSCFGLRIPSVAAPSKQVQASKERETHTDPLRGKRVAILEDDETAVEYLFTLLSDWGMDVSIALSSEMLKEMIFDEGAFDLILSDYHLNLEEETGLDVLVAAQAIQAHAPPKCVLITGDTTSDLMRTVQEHHIAVLYKPLRPVRLRAFLNSLFS